MDIWEKVGPGRGDAINSGPDGTVHPQSDQNSREARMNGSE